MVYTDINQANKQIRRLERSLLVQKTELKQLQEELKDAATSRENDMKVDFKDWQKLRDNNAFQHGDAILLTVTSWAWEDSTNSQRVCKHDSQIYFDTKITTDQNNLCNRLEENRHCSRLGHRLHSLWNMRKGGPKFVNPITTLAEMQESCTTDESVKCQPWSLLYPLGTGDLERPLRRNLVQQEPRHRTATMASWSALSCLFIAASDQNTPPLQHATHTQSPPRLVPPKHTSPPHPIPRH